MNPRELKFLTVAAIAATGLALAACGGGGSSTPTPTTQLTPQEMCEADGGTYADGACKSAAEVLAEKQAAQRMAISDAIAMARTAVNAVGNDSTDADVSAADAAIMAVTDAITAAADLPAAEKAANTGTVSALSAQLASAKTSRQMAMDDAAQAQRMAAINTAQTALSNAEAALAALGEDATDEARRDAQRMVAAAATTLRDVLRMNGGSDADIDAASGKAAVATAAADALQATITAAANAAAATRMANINAAQMTLSEAEEALAALGDDATDKETRDAHRAVENAAAALIAVLQANEGTADQIAAATMKRDSAKSMADALTSPIEIADQREAIRSALATVATAVAAVDDDSTDAEVKAADDAIAAARMAIEDATDLPDAETTAHAAVVDAHASILDTAKTSRAAVVAARADEAAAEAKAASNKVANTKKAAITAEADATTGQVRPFDGANAYDPDGADNTATNYRVTVKHTGSAVEVKVTDGALPAKNDPQYEQAETFGNGQMLVRNIGTDRKIIVLHTDIEAPDQVAFSSRYPFDVNRDTDTTAPEVYAVKADDNDKIASSGFPSGVTASKTYVVYDPDTAAGRATQFSGTFDGASGMYRCVATGGCTVSTDADGDFNALTAGEWEFAPNAGATVAEPDEDYLTYGFWLETTTKDGAISSYDTVQTFATSNLTPSTGLGTVTGTATYEGDAAGVYVHETKKEDGTLDTAISGRFTADVALKAYFDGTTTRTADTIDGTISNFDLDGGPANSWNVNVSAASIDTDTTGFSGVADGGGAAGTWDGTFHGTGDANDASVAPPVLVGEFNANFMNGAVAGAYGARKQQQ